jgi:hypothetical protein
MPAVALRALLLSLALVTCTAHAEQLSVLAGTSNTDDGNAHSYSWQIDYRQLFWNYAAASFAYLNEGHLPGHNRDGAALQLWAVTPRWQRFDFAIGAGPYAYFDTQAEPSASGYRDYHGVGEIYTGSLTWYPGERWFMRLNFSEIHTPGNLDTRTLMLGAGYQLDYLTTVLQGMAASGDAPEYLNELGPFGGQTVTNADIAEKSTAFGIEYRRHMSRHVDLTAMWLNEGDGLDGRHNGAAGEIWLTQSFFSQQLGVGLGVGPYVSLQSHRDADGHLAPEAEGLVSMTTSWRFTRTLRLRLTWHRSVTQDDQDRDVITLGLSWSFGKL